MQIGNGGTTGRLTATSAITNNANLTINRSDAFTQATDLGAGVAITGTGSFTQAGSGTTSLTAANTYTGATTISGGKLRLINTTGSATGTGTLALNGNTTTTLSGTGTSKGALTVTNGSRLAAGVNTSGPNGNFGVAGTLSLGTIGGMTLTDANLDFDLTNVATTVGLGVNDLIMSGGVLALTTTEAFTFYELDSSLITGSLYTLISGASSANTGVVTTGWTTNFLNGATYTPTYSFSGNDLQVSFAAIPEPNVAALLGGLGVLALFRRRR